MRHVIAAAGFVLAFAASPAVAHDGDHVMARPGPYVSPYGYPATQAPFRIDPELAARCGLHAGSFRPHEYAPVAWQRSRGGSDGLAGALIGGAVGGVIGNRIAGHGDRTLGTVAGAAVGAVAGAAIDRSDGDRHSEGAGWDHGGGYAGYGGECDGALPAGYTVIAIPGSRECRDEVETIEEWVPEYVTEPAPLRAAPRRAAPLRDKRTKLRRIK